MMKFHLAARGPICMDIVGSRLFLISGGTLFVTETSLTDRPAGCHWWSTGAHRLVVHRHRTEEEDREREGISFDECVSLPKTDLRLHGSIRSLWTGAAAVVIYFRAADSSVLYSKVPRYSRRKKKSTTMMRVWDPYRVLLSLEKAQHSTIV